MREFNGLCARVRAVRDCTRLRNRVSTRSGTPLSLNGMHIYGVTVPGVRVTGVRGARVTERERRKGRKSGKLGRRREREKKGYRSSALDVSGCAVRRYESQWHTLCSDCQRMPFDFNPPTTTTATTHRIFIGDVHPVACPDAPTHYDRVQVSTDRIFPLAIEFFPSLGIRFAA